jgi:hypothetical protein
MSFSINDIQIEPYPYNLGFIDGAFGAGKTSFLAFMGYMFGKDYDKVIANFKLDIPNAIFIKELTAPLLLSLNDENSDRRYLMLLHECYHYFDKRECMKPKNRKVGDALFQIRKLNVDIMGDIPRLSYLGMRPTEHATLFYSAIGKIVGEKNKFLYARMAVVNSGSNEINMVYPINYFFLDMNDIFDKKIFDTKEKVKPTQIPLISLSQSMLLEDEN